MNRIETYSRKATWPVAFALAAFIVAGCGGGSSGGGDAAAPVVDPVGAVCTAGAECVNLETAGNYVILATSGISNVATSAITGNIGVSPATSTALTGFSQQLHASGEFATSAQVTGELHAADYAEPTPTTLTTAIGHTGDAFADADGKGPIATSELNGGDLTGQDIPPGVHTWSTPVAVDSAGTVTLTGTETDVWVLRIAGTLTMNPGARVTLVGGALPQNVFWRTDDVVALDTTAHMEGIVLSGTGITLESGATVNGRLYATTSVTLIENTVTRPGL